MNNSPPLDLDAIARNLTYLDLAHLSPAEATDYEHELSAIAALNDALETAVLALSVHLPRSPTALHPRNCHQPFASDSASTAHQPSSIAPFLTRCPLAS